MRRDVQIEPIDHNHLNALETATRQQWGSTTIVTRGQTHQLKHLSGWVAILPSSLKRKDPHQAEETTLDSPDENQYIGWALTRENTEERSIELVALWTTIPNQGIGRALLDTVRDDAWHRCIRRLWLITTNDNVEALAFYQKQGFHLVALHPHAVTQARDTKPEIPTHGTNGIPLRDELELEWCPDANPPYQTDKQLQPGQLMQALQRATKRGLEAQSLVSISTSYHNVPQAGLPFQVRVLKQLQRKAAAKAIQVASKEIPRPPINPFLPHEPELFVADLSETHLAVLNKFNVLEHHMLIITRHFAPQESLLDEDDFAAASLCLQDLDGLVFYNAGEAAGASQPHKHMQFVLFPLADTTNTPLSPWIQKTPRHERTQQIEALPYEHSLIHWDTETTCPTGPVLYARYQKALQALRSGTTNPLRPYNLLLTREWMMIVPRSQEFCDAISINALGFVGCLLARTDADRQYIEQKGPLHILAHVGCRPDSPFVEE